MRCRSDRCRRRLGRLDRSGRVDRPGRRIESVAGVRSHAQVTGQVRQLLGAGRVPALLLIAIVLTMSTLVTPPALAQTASCQLAPIFIMLRDLVGRDRVGECVSPATRVDSGDVTQLTTRGTMTLR